MTPAFVAWVEDAFAPLGPVKVKRMFGGGGVWADGTMFALLADERVYLKTNEATRPAFVEAGCEEFVWDNPKTGAVWRSGYFEAPAHLFDDADELKRWSLRALDVARAGKARRAPKPRVSGPGTSRAASAGRRSRPR